VHACLTSKLNDSSSTNRKTSTTYAIIKLKCDPEAVTFYESNDVRIFMYLHVKRLLII